MKKLTALLLALVMMLSLCACGQGNNTAADPADESSETEVGQELTLEELKSIMALQRVLSYLDDTLRDPDSVSILGITAVSLPINPKGYYVVKIEYNAANGMGGKDRDEFYIELKRVDLGDNSEYFGNEAERNIRSGNNRKKYNDSINEGGEEIEVDVNTVLENIDLTKDELKDMMLEILEELDHT